MSSKSVHKPIATQDQVAWAKKAKGYIEDAKRCHSAGAERPAVISLVGALESLLRLRFGMGPRDLNALIGEFDKDSYFEGHIGIHPRSTHQCATCALHFLRKLRNSVHPNQWKDMTSDDYYGALMTVLLVSHHVLYCDTRLADFPADEIFPDVFTSLESLQDAAVAKE